jgi:hypothetical protein
VGAEAEAEECIGEAAEQSELMLGSGKLLGIARGVSASRRTLRCTELSGIHEYLAD